MKISQSNLLRSRIDNNKFKNINEELKEEEPAECINKKSENKIIQN